MEKVVREEGVTSPVVMVRGVMVTAIPDSILSTRLS